MAGAAMAWASPLFLPLLLLLLPSLAAVHAVAGAGSPAPSADCSDALLSLAGCLSYVQEGSAAAKPDESCCSGLKDVVRKEVACLCQAFQDSGNLGVALNITKALQLPDACKVKTPPFSKCHLSLPGVTDGAPAPSPSPGAPFFRGSSPSSSPSASPAGSGRDSAARAPSPSRSAAAAFPASTRAFFSAAAAAATLLACHVL